MNEHLMKLDIVEIGKRLYQKGFVASNDGNISVRLSENEILITPSGVSKGYMSASDILKVDLEGRVISGTLKPSSEMKMHLAVYKSRQDVKGIVHAHPQKATAFAVAGKACDKIAVPEAVFSIGRVALAEYATPTTDEVPRSVEKYIGTCDAILLSNHGALTVGKDLFDAYYKMESVELFAQISLTAQKLGGARKFSPPEVKKLEEVREKFGIRIGGSACLNCGTCTGTCGLEQSTKSEYEDLVTEITTKIMKEMNA